MYDPARDIFTSSEDPPMDPINEDTAERGNNTVVQDDQQPKLVQGMPNTKQAPKVSTRVTRCRSLRQP